jgi:hypothetical protein
MGGPFLLLLLVLQWILSICVSKEKRISPSKHKGEKK